VELSWLMKFRIAAAAVVGAALIGFMAWPLVKPADPLGAVSVFSGMISFGDAIIIIALAVASGFIAYFISWPYGCHIGILAAPFGLVIWAVRSGNVAEILQQNPSLAQRQALYASFVWEPIFWLAVVAAGFAGVMLAQKIRSKSKADQIFVKFDTSFNNCLNAAIALIGSALIAYIGLRIFAQDVQMPNESMGTVIAQPAIGQIAFAILLSFGLAAFAVKHFLNASFIWPIIAFVLVTSYANIVYANHDILQYLTLKWPAVFFSTSATAILPVQMAAFGTLGAVAGYWSALRYDYWRKHEC